MLGFPKYNFFDDSKIWIKFKNLVTDDVPESASPKNLWFTNLRAISSKLVGFVSSPGVVKDTDTILNAFQKIVGNIAELVTGVSSVNTKSGAVVLTTEHITDSAGKRYQTENQKIYNDATSSIQGQLDAKIGIIIKDVMPSSTIVGTVSETLTGIYKISANTFSPSDAFYFLARMERSIFTGSGLLRVRTGTSSTFSTSLPLIAYLNASSTFNSLERDFKIYAGNIEGLNSGLSAPTDKITSTSVKTQTPFNVLVDNWIFISINNVISTDSSYQSLVKILKE